MLPLNANASTLAQQLQHLFLTMIKILSEHTARHVVQKKTKSIEKDRSRTASVCTGLTRASIRIGIKFHVRMLVKTRKFQAASIPNHLLEILQQRKMHPKGVNAIRIFKPIGN